MSTIIFLRFMTKFETGDERRKTKDLEFGLKMKI